MNRRTFLAALIALPAGFSAAAKPGITFVPANHAQLMTPEQQARWLERLALSDIAVGYVEECDPRNPAKRLGWHVKGSIP